MYTIRVLVEDYCPISGLLGEHGLSILIEQGDTRILFDVGQSYRVLKNNSEKMKVNLNDVSLIVLSHCHYDHTGGLLGLIKNIGGRTIVAHPSVFRESFAIDGTLRYVGIPFKRRILEDAGANLLLCKNYVKIAENIYVSGEVKRYYPDYERIEKMYTVDNGMLARDHMYDDISLIIRDGDEISIITGCSHSGIVNIVKHCLEVTQAKSVKAVIGGLHLLGLDRMQVKEIANKLLELGVEKIYAGHCTGFEALCVLSETFKENFKRIYCGAVIKL